MWELFQTTGLGPEKGLALVLEAFFAVGPDVTMLEYTDALLAADMRLHQGQHLDAMKQVLWRHGLLRTLEPPGVLAPQHRTTSMSLCQAHLGDGVDEEAIIQQEGAEHIRLHFAGIDLQAGSGVGCLDGQCDSIYLYDGEGRLYAILGGRRGAFDAPVIPGDTVVVRWVTDRSVSSAGFTIDRYTWDGAGSDEGGCGCRIGGGGDRSNGAGVAFLLLLGAAAAFGRRPRRPSARQP
jgi:MYXO-CTERM domain-containing protein